MTQRRLLTLDGNEGAFYAGAAQIEIGYPEELLERMDLLRQDGRTVWTRSGPGGSAEAALPRRC